MISRSDLGNITIRIQWTVRVKQGKVREAGRSPPVLAEVNTPTSLRRSSSCRGANFVKHKGIFAFVFVNYFH
jgi:hypothetical protein